MRQASDYNNSNLSRCSKSARISSTTPLKLVTPHVHVALHASTLSAYIYICSPSRAAFFFVPLTPAFSSRQWAPPPPCALSPPTLLPIPLEQAPRFLTRSRSRVHRFRLDVVEWGVVEYRPGDAGLGWEGLCTHPSKVDRDTSSETGAVVDEIRYGPHRRIAGCGTRTRTPMWPPRIGARGPGAWGFGTP